MAKYSNNQQIFNALVAYQKLVRDNVDLIIKEEVTVLQQKLQRLHKLSEDKDEFDEAIKKLQQLNLEYKQACDSYDIYFVGFEASHTDLQNSLVAMDNEELIAKALSGRPQVHPIDFAVDASVEAIFTGMNSPVPLENLKSGWEQLGKKFNDKINEADGLVKAEEQAARARIAAKTDFTDGERKVAIENVESAMKSFNSVIVTRKEDFAAAEKANLEDFEEAVKRDEALASDIYNPVNMADSRLAYVANGILINEITSDTLFALEHSLEAKAAPENALQVENKPSEEKPEHKEESGAEPEKETTNDVVAHENTESSEEPTVEAISPVAESQGTEEESHADDNGN